MIELHRARHADADPLHVRRLAPHAGEHVEEVRVDLFEHRLRALGDVDLERHLRQWRCREIGHRQP
jgi:hypothetical protein